MNISTRIGVLAAMAVLVSCSSEQADAPAPTADASLDAADTGPPQDVARQEATAEAASEEASARDVNEEPDVEQDHASPPTEAGPDAPGACYPLDGAPVLTTAKFPRVDGSTSTLPLDMIIGCELLGVPWAWVVDPYDNTAYVYPDPKNADQQSKAEFLRSTIVHNKTDPAFVNLIRGDKDIIFVASKPSSDDLALANAAGVTLDYQAIGLDALVFLVNEANKISGLTSDQILKIYQGSISNWSVVGGSAGEIHPYIRPENSGSQELIKELLFKDNPMPDWPVDYQYMGTFMGGLVDMIATDPLSIGYTVYYFWMFQYPNYGTKMLGVDGVYPAYDTIKNRSYPYASEVYAIIRTNLDPTSTAYQLRQWLLTPKGQCVVSLSGYVPVAGP